jgi:hypothetical protein
VICLSVRQPWASLIIAGIKDVENRTWQTHYRGKLLIHAGKQHDRNAVPCIEHCNRPACDGCPLEVSRQQEVVGLDLPHGAIIGEVELVACIKLTTGPWVNPGCWQWVLALPKKYDKPIPYKGKLGLFEVKDADCAGPGGAS